MDFLDIANAVFYKTGGEVELNYESQKIYNLLKKRKKTVFILIDGMGKLILNNLLPNSFLNNHVIDEATTLFPSTTSVILTALATGKYPATHAVNGWFNYIEETNESIISLPFINRFVPEEKIKLNFNDLFYCDTRMQKIQGKVSMITPSAIVNSEYSMWSRGNTKGYGYRTLKGAFQTLSKLINKDDEKEYIYLYIDDFDTICHKFGPDSDEARDLLQTIDTFVEKYAKRYKDKVDTIITADHGQVRIQNENFFTINSKDEMMSLLKAPPCGDSRCVCFHVKEGKHKEFKEMYNLRYGKYSKLLSQKELDESHVFGPEAMCDRAKSRFGDFCAIFDKEHAFLYVKDDFDRNKLKKGCHSGNSEEEMKIPLIILN